VPDWEVTGGGCYPKETDYMVQENVDGNKRELRLKMAKADEKEESGLNGSGIKRRERGKVKLGLHRPRPSALAKFSGRQNGKKSDFLEGLKEKR
jgi:hypothetical protein